MSTNCLLHAILKLQYASHQDKYKDDKGNLFGAKVLNVTFVVANMHTIEM